MENLTEIQKQYINRPIEEEFLSFEEFQKIINLRIIPKKTTSIVKNKFNVGDRIWIFVKSGKIGGEISNVNEDGTYNITSKITNFNNVSSNRILIRKYEDLSHIEIPVELKKISTDRLLNAFKKSLRYVWNENVKYDELVHFPIIINDVEYDPIIKAILNKREHIFSNIDKNLIEELK